MFFNFLRFGFYFFCVYFRNVNALAVVREARAIGYVCVVYLSDCNLFGYFFNYVRLFNFLHRSALVCMVDNVRFDRYLVAKVYFRPFLWDNGVLVVFLRVFRDANFACVDVYRIVLFLCDGVGVLRDFNEFLCLVNAGTAIVYGCKVLIIYLYRVDAGFYMDFLMVFDFGDDLAVISRLNEIDVLHGRVHDYAA